MVNGTNVNKSRPVLRKVLTSPADGVDQEDSFREMIDHAKPRSPTDRPKPLEWMSKQARAFFEDDVDNCRTCSVEVVADE